MPSRNLSQTSARDLPGPTPSSPGSGMPATSPVPSAAAGADRAASHRAWRAEAGALVLFVLLAAFHTWPLASAPGTWSRNDSGDALLNEWTIAWVAHQLPRAPLRLFDANIFYPEQRTLVFSEHLLPQALVAAPVLWAGGSPVLAYNVSLLVGLALTAWAMCFVVRRWTGSWGAGLVAGSLAAFNAHTLTRLTHLQAQHLEFLPLALFALDRLLASPRARHALALGGWFALQALTSGYFLTFTAVAMLASVAARPAEWLGARFRQAAPRLLLAAGTAFALLLPFLAAYWRVRREHGLMRTMGELRVYSASFGDYLATGSLLHWSWSKPYWQGDGFFPGIVALCLLGIALASGAAFKDRRARMWLVVGLVCFALSFGVKFTPYVWLYKAVPLFQGIRAVKRFGQFALVAAAALAGFGAAWSLGRVRAGARRTTLALVLLVLVNAEAWRGPLWYYRFEGTPRIFTTLAGVPHAVVACFPLYWFGAEIGGNARYMLDSTANWQPMINGYSGFVPGSFMRHVEALRRFPDEASLVYLHKIGVTHVVVDRQKFGGPRGEAVTRTDALRLWLSDERYSIYELR